MKELIGRKVKVESSFFTGGVSVFLHNSVRTIEKVNWGNDEGQVCVSVRCEEYDNELWAVILPMQGYLVEEDECTSE